MADIVEKLKDACVIDRHYGKSVTLTLDYDDYMEAADEITRLRAEVEKLRALVVKADEAIARQQQDLEKASDQAADCDILRAEVERLRAALDLYREAVRVDATMEGPKFMGSNASALKRAWDADRAALEENTNDKG